MTSHPPPQFSAKFRIAAVFIAVIAWFALAYWQYQEYRQEHPPKFADPELDHRLDKGLSSVGSIDSIQLPKGWILTHHSEDARGYGYLWAPGGEKGEKAGVTFSVGWSGQSYEGDQAKSLQELFTREPHVLSSDEIHTMEWYFNQFDNPDLQIDVVDTWDIDGQRIVHVQGSSLEDSRRIYLEKIQLNAGGDGTVIQGLTFAAPMDVKAKCLPEAHQIFGSLRVRP